MHIPELERFRIKIKRMRDFQTFPHDPRFNALYWISDCWFLSYQIEFSANEMGKRAREYQQYVRPGDRPANSDPRLNYFADNAIIRLLAFRDKLGLSLLSYFYIVDPRKKVYEFSEIVDLLASSTSHNLTGADKACQILNRICPIPQVLKQYRDAKIHRRDPRIEIYGVRSHHGGPYYVAIDESLNTNRPAASTAFRSLDAKESPELFAYQRLSKALKQYRRTCYRAADECATFLRRRKPFAGLTSRV